MPTVYSPPVSTYTALATTTLASSASSVTFSSISGYRDLIILQRAVGTGGGTSRLQFNADAGSNYTWVYLKATSSSTGSTTSLDLGIMEGSIATWQYPMKTEILDAGASDKHKTILSHAGVHSDTGNSNYTMAGRWANTDAITSITLFPSTGSYATGSRFDLFGVVS